MFYQLPGIGLNRLEWWWFVFLVSSCGSSSPSGRWNENGEGVAGAMSAAVRLRALASSGKLWKQQMQQQWGEIWSVRGFVSLAPLDTRGCLGIEEVEKVLSDVKAGDVRVIPVGGQCGWTDHMVVATGKSAWHVRNIAQALVYKAGSLFQSSVYLPFPFFLLQSAPMDLLRSGLIRPELHSSSDTSQIIPDIAFNVLIVYCWFKCSFVSHQLENVFMENLAVLGRLWFTSLSTLMAALPCENRRNRSRRGLIGCCSPA